MADLKYMSFPVTQEFKDRIEREAKSIPYRSVSRWIRETLESALPPKHRKPRRPGKGDGE